MQFVARGWLVYRLTNSAFLLGLVGFSGQIPMLFLGPIAGVIADRMNRHRLLVITQTFAMLLALIFFILVVTNTIRIWEIVALSSALGIVNSFDMPIRQSFVIEMIDEKDDLGNAIALNSTMVNGARLIGPSIAGILIVATGEHMCFLVNAVSYLAVIASLLMMRITPKTPQGQETEIWKGLKEGFSYASGFKPIRAILLLLALVSIVGMPYTVLLPVFARDILHGGPDTLGFLMGAIGIGAVTGALYLAQRKSVIGLGNVIPIASVIFGIGLVAFSFSHSYHLSLALMLITGIGQMIQLAGCNTILQTIVDDDKRGRIMSLYSMAFMGMTPIGSLIAGSLAGQIGAGWTVCLSGIVCIAGAAVFASQLPELRRLARPVYIKKGIISETSATI
jgi:MFS family permease